MNERDIFLAALDISDPLEQAKYLAERCGKDELLRRQVDALLAAYAAASAFLEHPADRGRTATFTPTNKTDDAAGMLIAGKYKLIEQVGEGGMGSVWMAQQTEPVKRYVAVKLIKSGMDSKQLLARFEAERQALAVMDHPNIAKILDGGVAENGSPYFVMELVKGVPITRYCDEQKLTLQQRLELFLPVCQAIQHAHQKGIIHRDIKPSNVMVALYDDKAVPKVIDFGVAKATGQTLTEQTLHTGFGGIIGTPEYMSPEQASLNNLDIDTRSDIYSLGVLLYELLAGSPPFKHKDLEKAGLLEMLRVIREEEPPKPSTKLSTAATLPSLSTNRATEPKKLAGILRNELDWIVMKALEKNRSRRYETANGFAADITRYLAGEPVTAHPPSATYRLKKFVRKNKGPVLAGTTVAAALIMGAIGFAWQARLAQQERDRAVIAETESRKRADDLQKVADFEANMLGQIDSNRAGKLLSDDIRARYVAVLVRDKVPESERDKLITTFNDQWKRLNATDTARELLKRVMLKPALEGIDKEFADQPVVDAALRQVLAIQYREMGMYDYALSLQEKALLTRRRVLGDEHPDTLKSIDSMGMLLIHLGKASEAEPYLRDALEKRRLLSGEEQPDTLQSIFHMGTLLQNLGKLDEAERYFRLALEKRRRVLGEEHPDTLSTVDALGMLIRAQGKPAEAERYFREALEKGRRVMGEDHMVVLVALNNLGLVLREQSKLRDAEPFFREALASRRRVMGEDHPSTLITIGNMGSILRAQGKLNEAEPYFREQYETSRRALGEESIYTLQAIRNMGILREAQENHSEAVKLLSSVEAALRKEYTGGNKWRLASLLMYLGKARTGLREYSAAEPKLLEAQADFASHRGQEDGDTRECVQALAELYTAWHAAEPGKGYDTKASIWKSKKDQTRQLNHSASK